MGVADGPLLDDQLSEGQKKVSESLSCPSRCRDEQMFSCCNLRPSLLLQIRRLANLLFKPSRDQWVKLGQDALTRLHHFILIKNYGQNQSERKCASQKVT